MYVCRIPEQAADCPLLKWGPALTSPAPFYDAIQVRALIVHTVIIVRVCMVIEK